MLARKLNAVGHTHKPIRLNSGRGAPTSDPTKVTAAFTGFMATLYGRPSPFLLNLAEAFFRDLHLAPISSAAQAALNADITELEIAKAIKSISFSKAPGPDGFSLLPEIFLPSASPLDGLL